MQQRRLDNRWAWTGSGSGVSSDVLEGWGKSQGRMDKEGKRKKKRKVKDIKKMKRGKRKEIV